MVKHRYLKLGLTKQPVGAPMPAKLRIPVSGWAPITFEHGYHKTTNHMMVNALVKGRYSPNQDPCVHYNSAGQAVTAASAPLHSFTEVNEEEYIKAMQDVGVLKPSAPLNEEQLHGTGVKSGSQNS